MRSPDTVALRDGLARSGSRANPAATRAPPASSEGRKSPAGRAEKDGERNFGRTLDAPGGRTGAVLLNAKPYDLWLSSMSHTSVFLSHLVRDWSSMSITCVRVLPSGPSGSGITSAVAETPPNPPSLPVAGESDPPAL